MSDAENEFAGLPEDEEEFVEDKAGAEGSEGGGEGSVDSSEEEEEDGENEYEVDGFVVDEEEDGGDGEGDAEGSDVEVPKSKKKKRKRNFALDEEDYMLLEDNQVRVKRPQERKRLKRRGDGHERGREKANGVKQLQEALFGTGDLEDELADLQDGKPAEDKEGSAGAAERRQRYDDFGDVSDEMDDFIVDGDGEGDRRRSRRRRDSRVAQAAGLSTAAVQAANRLFGNFGELLDLHQSHRMFDRPDADGLDDEVEDDEEQDEAMEDEDDAERRRQERQERAAAKKQQKLLAQVDPELVENHYLRPDDHAIRQADVPERLALLGKSVLESVAEDQRRTVLDEAARWVSDNLFGQHSQESKIREVVEDGIVEVTGDYPGPNGLRTPGEEHFWPKWQLDDTDTDMDLRNNRAVLARRGRRIPERFSKSREELARDERRILDSWRKDADKQAGLRQSIRAVLEHAFEKHEEVPLQAMFRKEQCGELLSLRETDRPETTGNEHKDVQTEPDERWPRGTIQPKHRRIRRWDVLWAVYNWGTRFMELYRRRQKRIEVYNSIYEQAATDEERDAIAACHDQLMLTYNPHAIDDIDAKFRYVTDLAKAMGDLNVENGGGSGTARRPGRPNSLRRFLKYGLGEAARDISISMQQFKENIDHMELRNMPEDPSVSPLEWAEQQISARGFTLEEERARMGALAKPDSFLAAVKEILATELAAEPCLRQVVRSELYQHALVTTTPTTAGEEVLDPFHPYGITKHLVNKRVQTLEGTDTWLRILAAEKQGYIKLEITWPDDNLKITVTNVGELYISDNIADVATKWNSLRKEVLSVAVRRKLLPVMLQELRARLTSNAIDTVLGVAGDRFWQFVCQPPIKIMEVPDEQDQEPVQMEAPRVMAVVWGSGQQGEGPTTIVQLDGQGNLKDLLTAAQLSGNIPRTVNSGSREQPVFDPAADPKKSRDSHKLREKILEHKPNAILVGTSSPQSKQLKDDMEKISQYTESDSRFKEELLPHLENKRVEVMWADDQAAALWANGEAAKGEFPDYSFLVRKAVGLGRIALDPLAVIATLCGRRKEILSLRLHEMQDRLPREALATRLEQTLITAVAQVGVDINAMAANPWRQAPLQLVPGLGPRKARALLAAIAANDNHIKTRVDLLKQDDTPFGAGANSEVAQMGPTVFRNAAPFLRVRRGEVAALQNEDEFDALDDARIHPENEALLQVILEEAFPDLVEAGAGVDMRTAIEAPLNLQQLDLWAVADANNFMFKLPTLVDMLHELLAPYGEVRQGLPTPTEEDAFYLRHGETRESLKRGKLVDAKVVWVGETEAKVIIQQNGMEAIIPQVLVSSDPAAAIIMSNQFKIGQMVTARINDTGDQETGYDENQRRRYVVTLTTRSQDLTDHEKYERMYCSSVDRSYRPPDRQQQQQQAAQAMPVLRPASRVQLQKRMIQHPMWRPVRSSEAAKLLEDQPTGSCIFRPAHKPSIAEQLSMIALTIKLAQLATGPLIYHVEVKEAGNKPPKVSRLVPPLRIAIAGQPNMEQYDDLDEVVARYVEPMVERVNEVFMHRKAVDGDQTAINNQVRAMLNAQGQGSMAGVYCVALDSHRPGTGCLAFAAGGATANVHREYFTITPNGYFFRGKVYPSVEHVISAFKTRPNYKKEQQAQQRDQQVQGAGFGGVPQQQQVPLQMMAGPGQGYHHMQQQPAGLYGMPAAAVGAGGYMAPAAPAPVGYTAPHAAAAAAPYGGPQGGYRQQPPPQGYQQAGYGQQQPPIGYGGHAPGQQQPPPYGGPAGGYQPGVGAGGSYQAAGRGGGYQQASYHQQQQGYYPRR